MIHKCQYWAQISTLCCIPFRKTSEAKEQHLRPVLFPLSPDAELSTAAGARERGLISQCMVVTCTFVSLNLWTPLTCGVLGTLGIDSKCSLPLFSDVVQKPSRQLWLSLDVESTEETLPYRLQWLLWAPEHPIQIHISAKWLLVNLNVWKKAPCYIMKDKLKSILWLTVFFLFCLFNGIVKHVAPLHRSIELPQI